MGCGGNEMLEREGEMSAKGRAALRVGIAVLVVAAVAAIGVLVTLKTAGYQREQYFEVRKFQAAAAASIIDYREVQSLKGSEDDYANPAFWKLHSELRRMKLSDSRIRFAYLMRPGGDRMVFLVDAEERSSEDYSPPGQVYFEAKPEDFLVFRGEMKPEPLIEGPVTDRWGTWISATAYVTDPDGEAVALLGTDVNVARALASFSEIKRVGLLFTIVSSVLVALIMAQWITWRFGRDRKLALRGEFEESLTRLNQELVQADQEKSEFIERASHELRGPLAAVDGAMQLMERHFSGQLDEVGQQLVEIARTGTKRLAELVENLFDISLIESGGFGLEPVEVDIDSLVAETVKEFGALAMEKGLALEKGVTAGGAKLTTDPQAVRRVLENLLANAIKYTDSGEVAVSVGGYEESVRIEVSDTGRGIPEQFQQEVFGKFTRLEQPSGSRTRGSGLGLTICKGLAEGLGGRIWLESTEGEGSTFYFEIPRRAYGTA